MRVAGSGTASAGAGSGNEGNKATKNGGNDPVLNSPVLIPRGRLQWNTHQVSVDHAPGFSGGCLGVGLWVGVVCTSPGRRLTFSENPGKILGESRARRKILGVICRTFWEFCIIRRHRSRVHQS